MKSLRTYKNCDMYEEHGGEYWQGCWEWNDMCYMAIEDKMSELGYSHNCSKNIGICPYHLRIKGEK